MKTLKKWNGKAVEDDVMYMSKSAKSFATAFKNMLKRELGTKGITVENFQIGHYDLSCFLKSSDDKCVYINYSIPRYGEKIDFTKHSCSGGVLYRTAKDSKTYSGKTGCNHFTSINNLPNAILEMYEDEREWDEKHWF